MNSNFSELTIAEANQILKRDSLARNSHTVKGATMATEMLPNGDRLRQALELVARHSEYQILGICAQTAREGLQAMNEYSQALGYEPPEDLESIEGPVYIKFNPNIGLRYMSAYEGKDRGVLVSCQSPNSDGLNEMYGHLPMDLFAIERKDNS